VRTIGGKRVRNMSPTFSPDGGRIAFSRDFCDASGRCERHAGIWVSPTAGGALQQIAPSGGCPAWSPDGSRVMYVNFADGSLRVVSTSGGASKVVVRDVGCNSSFPPSWAPNSRSVAAVDAVGRPQGQLVIADLTTRRSRIVTRMAFAAVNGFSWSRDSAELLVTASPAPTACSALWIVSTNAPQVACSAVAAKQLQPRAGGVPHGDLSVLRPISWW
jgi:Tol biopolymer transport system component